MIAGEGCATSRGSSSRRPGSNRDGRPFAESKVIAGFWIIKVKSGRGNQPMK
jgi:hypothetical protein